MNIKRARADLVYFAGNLRVPSAKGDAVFREAWAPFQQAYFARLDPIIRAVETGEEPSTNQVWDERSKGGSKDTDNAIVLLHALAFSRRPLDLQCGAADRDQAGEVRKAIRDLLRLNPSLAERVEVQSWSVVCKATRCELSILATDVASAHGSRPDILFVNELSHIAQEDFASNLFDNATKKPRGLRIVATNAGFQGTWQARWRRLAQDSRRWFFHALSEPAPWLSEEELAEAERRNSRARFARLFHGVWIPKLGDALDSEDITACIAPSGPPPSSPGSSYHVAGLDLGIKHDHSAFALLRVDKHSQYIHTVDLRAWTPDVRTGKVDLIAVESYCYRAHTRFNLRSLAYDPYQAALLSQRLALRGVPMREMTFTGANLNLMASTLLDVFRSRRITIPNDPRLIDDLNKLQIEERSYGHRLTAVSDETGHADLATALAIALPVAVEEAGTVRPVARALLEHDPNKPMGWREIADELDRKAGRIAGAAGWGVDAAQNENMMKALNDLHRTDPFFQQFRRR